MVASRLVSTAVWLVTLNDGKDVCRVTNVGRAPFARYLTCYLMDDDGWIDMHEPVYMTIDEWNERWLLNI